MRTLGCLSWGTAEVSGNAVHEWGFWTGGFDIWYSSKDWPCHRGGAESSASESLPLNGPVSLDKNPCRSYLEAVKFRALEEKEMGHHSAQHTLSLSCFQYGAMPSPSHGLVSPGPDHLGVSPCRRQPLPLCCQGGRGAVSRPSGLGEGTLGSQGSLGSLPSTSVFQVIICTDAWKYQVPSNLGLSGVLQHKWT